MVSVSTAMSQHSNTSSSGSSRSMFRVFAFHPAQISPTPPLRAPAGPPPSMSSTTPNTDLPPPSTSGEGCPPTATAAVPNPPGDHLRSYAIPQPSHSRPVQIVKAHPCDLAYLFFLLLVLGGIIAGLAVYTTLRSSPSQDENSMPRGFFANAIFISASVQFSRSLSYTTTGVSGLILRLLVVCFLLFRQTYYIYFLIFAPRRNSATSASAGYEVHPSINSPRQRSGSGAGRSIPNWLLPRPPPYVDAVGGTGDIEDGDISMSRDLPKYGDHRGSILLLRSESRGGPVGVSMVDAGAGVTLNPGLRSAMPSDEMGTARLSTSGESVKSDETLVGNEAKLDGISK